MSQPDSQSGSACMLATLGGLPQTKEIIDLSKDVHASTSALTASECPSPQPPRTIDEEAWNSYTDSTLARIESQRQRRTNELKLQCRQDQVNRLSDIWSQFVEEASRPWCPGDTPALEHPRGRQQQERLLEDAQQPNGEQHPEAVGEERPGRCWDGPATQTSPQPETPRTPGEEEAATVTFQDVWNNGSPRDKIIEPEPGVKRYYVLRCRRGECLALDRRLGPSPFRAARAHLGQRHSEELGPDLQLNNANILRLIGIHVMDCDKELAEKSNAAFVAWYNTASSSTKEMDQSGCPQPASDTPAITRQSLGKRPISPVESDETSDSTSIKVKRTKKVEDIEAGAVYCFEEPGAKRSAAIILPMFEDCPAELAAVLKRAHDLGFFSQAANAINPVPKCIDYDEEREIARGWVDEQGSGTNACERHHPALLITGPDYPRCTKPRWVKAEHLRRYDEIFDDWEGDEGFGVDEYLRQMAEAGARAEGDDASTSELSTPHAWGNEDITDQTSADPVDKHGQSTHTQQSGAAYSDATPEPSCETVDAPPELSGQATSVQSTESPCDTPDLEGTTHEVNLLGQSDAITETWSKAAGKDASAGMLGF